MLQASPRSTQRKDRAIALITTMAALVVVVMLVGAFLATRQSYIAMSRYTAEEQACRDTLRSVADFCRFRLEGHESWGTTPGEPADSVEFRDLNGGVVFSLEALTRAQAAARAEFDGLPGLAFFAGKAPRVGVELQIGLSNNLDNDEANESAGVAAKSCRMCVRASRGGHAEKVEVLLRRAAFFDSTVAASDKIDIDAAKVDFSSTDPLRNQIRSKGLIELPAVENITFTPDPDVQTPEKGTVWAQGAITINEVGTEAKLREAAETTGGEFLPNATTRYSVPELKKADLDADGSKPIVLLRPATYAFKKEHIFYLDTVGVLHQRDIPTLEIHDASDSPTGDLVNFHFARDAMFEPLDPENPIPLDHTPDPETVYIEIDAAGTQMAGIKEDNPEIDIDSGPSIELPVNIYDTPRLTLSADVDYRVKPMPGAPLADFKVKSDISAAAVDFKDSDPDPDHPQEGFISAERDLVIEGFLGNCGKLLAGRDVELLPRDVTIDKLEETNDLAVYAGHDVRIQPLFNGDEATRTDARRYFAFRGLVYAENDFSFLSSVADPQEGGTAQFNRKLFVEGALVARQGEVYIQGKESVELKYNREFLDDLMEKSFEEDHAQLEELSWRPL